MSAFDIGIGIVGHEVLTFAWLLCALVLLKFQGVRLLNCCELIHELVYERLWRRITTCPRMPTCPCLWIVFAVCSFLSLTWGVGSGFIIIGPPSSWLGAFESFPLIFFMVAFFEESFFRGILIRRPTERGRGMMRGVSWSSLDGVPMGGMDPRLAEDFASPSSVQEEVQKEVALLIRSKSMQSEDYRRLWAPVPPRPPLAEMLANASIFVVYHLGVFHSAHTFQDWRFLVCVSLCGLCCFELLIRTQSIWPSVLAHGLLTWSWLAFGGGDCDLHTPGCKQ